MPAQKPGSSKQDYCTPPELLRALEKRLNIDFFACDLAASNENHIAEQWYSEEENSLVQSWSDWYGWCFCNPPYADIEPWVRKAYWESKLGAQVAMLLPASVGSNWYRDWVHNKCHVLFMNGRVQFVGAKDLYPKDTMILLYTPYITSGTDVWSWNA
jgi:phage N-6-adenine-methyltransferase